MATPTTPAFIKATKSQAKLRAAFFGPSGAGKTFSALRVATGLTGLDTAPVGAIAVIDTERGSAAKYSDRFTFDVCELADRSIDGYCQAINAAAAAGYKVLIIDSLSHAWQQLLERVEKLAQAKYRGNTWSAWSEGTPEQRQLIDTLLDFPGHIIATMRSRTEWTTQQNDRGKSTPVRVGLAPEQGKGIEYEFDLLFELSDGHVGHVLKDRTGKFQDALIETPGEDFGRELAAWLADGTPATPRTPAAAPPTPTQAAPPASQAAPEPPLSQDEQAAWLETYDAAAAERGLDLAAAQQMLVNAMRALGVDDKTVTESVFGKCLNAIQQGKWDGKIKEIAEAARVAATAAAAASQAAPPASTPATPPPPAAGPQQLTQEVLDRIANIENWEQFNTAINELAPDSMNDVEIAHGIAAAVRLIQRTGKEAQISRPRLREWATAIAAGTFDWPTGKIRK